MDAASRVADDRRAVLVERLRRKAADADEGRTTDTTNLTDDQFIALIRR